jgi:hypothetical protein
MHSVLWIFGALTSGTASAAQINVQPGDDVGGLTQSLRAGDAIIFQDGVHVITDSLSWFEAVGTADQPIEIKSAPDAKPILRMMEGWQILHIEDSAHMNISGLTFEGGTGWEDAGFSGVRIENSSNITLDNIEVRQVAGTALRIDGDCSGLLIANSQLHTTFEGHGLEVGCSDASCFVTDSVISGNWIHDIGGESSGGLRLLHGSQGIAVTDNNIHDIGDDGAYLGSAENGVVNVFTGNAIWAVLDDGLVVEGASRVHNNIVAHTGEYGIYTVNGSRDTLDDVAITHNTVVETGAEGLRLNDVYARDSIRIANNAVANPTGRGLRFDSNWDEYSAPSTVYMRNNVVSGLVEYLPEEMYEGGIVPGGGFADFEDAPILDFYPSGDSLLVNAGDPASESFVPEFDFNGLPREGDQPDAGAFEWDGLGNPAGALEPGFKSAPEASSGATYDVSTGGCCGKNKTADDEGTQAAILLPLLLLAGFRRREDQ